VAFLHLGTWLGQYRIPLSSASPMYKTDSPRAGLAITGSPLDAFDSVPWIVRLREELAAASQRKQRLLGICFGCQALAISLGGDAGGQGSSVNNA